MICGKSTVGMIGKNRSTLPVGQQGETKGWVSESVQLLALEKKST